MPDQPLAPLLVMKQGDHEFLSDADAFANGRWSREDVRRLLLAELDAQRAARATAYAEGLNDAINQLLREGVKTLNGIHWIWRDRAIEHLLALRDTPAPPREEPR